MLFVNPQGLPHLKNTSKSREFQAWTELIEDSDWPVEWKRVYTFVMYYNFKHQLQVSLVSDTGFYIKTADILALQQPVCTQIDDVHHEIQSIVKPCVYYKRRLGFSTNSEDVVFRVLRNKPAVVG